MVNIWYYEELTTIWSTLMDAVLAETSIGITELKKNPSAVIRNAGTETIVVLHHNKPSAYLVPARTYEALMDVLDDLQLIPVVQQRISAWQTAPDNVIELAKADLEKIARGTKPKSSKPRASTKPLAAAL
jgi:antitoxin StbD